MYAAISRKVTGVNAATVKLLSGAAFAVTVPIMVAVDNYYFVGEPNAFDMPSPAEWTLLIGSAVYFGYMAFKWLGWGRTYNAAPVETFRQPEPESDLADRLLLPLVTEVEMLLETAARVGVQVRAMAECRGIEPAA